MKLEKLCRKKEGSVVERAGMNEWWPINPPATLRGSG